MKTLHYIVNTRTGKTVRKEKSLHSAMLYLAMMRHSNSFIIVPVRG